MSKEAILKIREAEERAELIREAAEAEAQKRIEHAEKEGVALVARMTSAAASDIKDRLYEVTERSGELVDESRQDATADISKLEELARVNMRDASKLIVWGIFDLCQ